MNILAHLLLVLSCAYSYCSLSAHNNVINTAEQYIGIGEYNQPKTLIQLFQSTGNGYYDPRRGSWCAIFLNSVLQKNGINGTHSLAARSFLHWGHYTNNPIVGDIVVFKDMTRRHNPSHGHVGIFMGFEGNYYVKVLGGNEDKMVKIKFYPVSYVIGYRGY